MKPPLVYIAGKYTGANGWEVDCNIQAARMVGAEVAKLGAMPVIPHSNTAHFDGIQDYEFWIAGTLELLRVCRAVVMVPGWEHSKGAIGERNEAQLIGLPVFEFASDVEHLTAWLAGERAGKKAPSPPGCVLCGDALLPGEHGWHESHDVTVMR